MAQYAAGTDVSPDRSRAEIERTLQRYGATGFMYGWQDTEAVLGFVVGGLQVRFLLPMPDRNDEDFTKTPTGKTRSLNQQQAAYEQATKQRWRAMALMVKAKLEAVEAGIVTLEEEFLAHVVLPNGQTIGQHVIPDMKTALAEGRMPDRLAIEGGHRGNQAKS